MKAVSYRGQAPDFSVADYKWEQVGDGGIQTTPTQLVRWADNYRTGKVGGPDWKRAVLEGSVEVPPNAAGRVERYGAGIVEGDDGAVYHPGSWEGFVTDFWISPDRTWSIAVTCNKFMELVDLREALVSIWAAP